MLFRLSIAALLLTVVTPAFALELNALRAEARLPPLSYNATLAGAAYEHARDMAKRKTLDHKDFKARMAGVVSGVAAENVSYGCDNQPCAVRQWAKSPGHRRNMLMKGVSSYGIGSAVSEDGRRYWVMVLGN